MALLLRLLFELQPKPAWTEPMMWSAGLAQYPVFSYCVWVNGDVTIEKLDRDRLAVAAVAGAECVTVYTPKRPNYVWE